MPVVRANGLDLTYETIGDPADPPLLLIMGLGAQLIDWPAGFVKLLAARGFHVILFDNRDAGLSTALDELGQADIQAIFGGDPSSAPYLLSDLADDAAALLKALGIPRAHVVGASMGGMIAQQLTIDHPDLVASLCSVMSTTGDRSVGAPTPAAFAVLLRPPAATREEMLANALDTSRVIGSTVYPLADEDACAASTPKSTAATARPAPPASTRPSSPPRPHARLREITVPTLVLHGDADPLITLSGGEATAAAIPGSRLRVFPGMAHDLPEPLWTDVIDEVVANTRR